MTAQTGRHFIRPIALIISVAGILLLGLNNTSWATPVQGKQTVPTATPTSRPGGGGGGGGGDQTPTPFPEADPPATSGTPGTEPGETAEPGETPEATPDDEDDFVTVIVEPGEDGSLDLFPWETIVSPGDFEEPVVIDGRFLPDGERPLPNPDQIQTGPAIDIVARDENGNQIPATNFTNPIEVRYYLSPAELALIDNDLSRAIIQVYDPSSGIWIDLPTTINPDGSVSVFVNYTGRFALRLVGPGELVPVVLPETGGPPWNRTQPPASGERPEPPLPAALPNTGEPAQTVPGGWVTVVIALLIAGGLLLTRWARRLQSR